MTVKEYYYQHFDELSEEKKFHFATRIKNFFHSHDFDDYLANNIPSQDLAPIFDNNDFSNVNNYAERKPFFEKYPNLYGIEAALFRTNHLLNEYKIDVRDQFQNFCSKERLYALSDELLSDDDAIAVLSTWAVNTICLTEILFPRGQDVVSALGRKSLSLPSSDPALLVYLFTHIILCDSNFYTRPVQKVELSKKLLSRAGELISQNFDSLPLDVRLEFLVCAKMLGVSYPDITQRLKDECTKILEEAPFLIDKRRPSEYQTFNRSEHRNVLFIMSGLDS